MHYSIKDLEEFSGIKAHTIRIWEQRYKLFEPKRTPTNIRFYTEADLKKILNCKLLNENGLKVSKIAALSDADIEIKSKQLLLECIEDHSIESLSLAVATFDQELIKHKLNESYAASGLVSTYENIISPLLNRIGQLWQVNTISVAHEHFLSNIVREFIIAKTNALPELNTREKVLLFLHEFELHELPLLISYYHLKKAGFKCYYFGYSLPLNDLQIALNQIKPEIVFTSFISKVAPQTIEKIAGSVKEEKSVKNFFVTGGQSIKQEDELPGSITILHNSKEMSDFFV